MGVLERELAQSIFAGLCKKQTSFTDWYVLSYFFFPPGLHLQIPQKTDFYNVSAFSVEYVRLGRLHSVSPAGLSCKPTYIHYGFLSEAGWVSSFCPISAPWFRDKSLWLRENQPARRRWRWALGNYPPTHNISIWDFRDFSRHFTDDIFKRPTLFIYLFKIKLSSLSDSVKSAPNASLLPSKSADEGICRSAFFKRFCSL